MKRQAASARTGSSRTKTIAKKIAKKLTKPEPKTIPSVVARSARDSRPAIAPAPVPPLADELAKKSPRSIRPATAPAPVTPLAERLRAPSRATPQALFSLAMEKWKRGERFDIGRMAQELGVSRATAFRWVGSRELLYGEVISSLFDAALVSARSEATGEGAAFVVDVTHRLMNALVRDEPLRRFVQQDTEYAMRVLMSKSSTVEQRSAASVRGALEEAAAAGLIKPAMDVDALAYLIVRIGESFLYRDAITGDAPDIDAAITAIRILVSARKDDL